MNQALWDLTHHKVHLDIPTQGRSFGATENLGFGAHQSWVRGYVLTTAGYGDTGFAEIRRAAEYVCYAAKIIGNDDRLALWEQRSEGIEPRKRFDREMGLPRAYLAPKYAFLRPLLVLHEEASEIGAHGNATILMRQWTTGDRGERRWAYQLSADQVVNSAVAVLIYGLRVLYALRHVLANNVRDAERLQCTVATTTDRVRATVAELQNDRAATLADEACPEFDRLYQKLLRRNGLAPDDANPS